MVRATALGLTWKEVEALDDEALDVRLYGPRCTTRDARPLPDAAALHVELRRTGRQQEHHRGIAGANE